MKKYLTAKALQWNLAKFDGSAKLYYTLPDEEDSTSEKMYIERLYEGNEANDATGLIFTKCRDNAMTSSDIQMRLKSSRQNMPVCLVIGQKDYNISLLISDVFPDKNRDMQIEFEVEK